MATIRHQFKCNKCGKVFDKRKQFSKTLDMKNKNVPSLIKMRNILMDEIAQWKSQKISCEDCCEAS